MTEITRNTLAGAKAQIAILDERDAWAGLLSKDVPPEITGWVTHQLRAGKDIDQLREQMGMRSGTDTRWRKIMSAIRTGRRVDATAVFVKWMERNEQLSDLLHQDLLEQLNEAKPMSKMTMLALQTLSGLQLNTVRLGKELGVFVDPADKGSGNGQGVTIVVQTNVPSPSKEQIIVHQSEREKKNIEILELNKPREDTPTE